MSGRPLEAADDAMLSRLNDRIRAEQALTIEGRAENRPVDGGWFCTQSQRLYPVRDGVLCLLNDQALDLAWDATVAQSRPQPSAPVPQEDL
jgi:uncharacterized protein YbaR (Trm112 family)